MRTDDLYLNIYTRHIGIAPDLLSRDDVSGTKNCKIIWRSAAAAVHSNTIACIMYIDIIAIYSISTVVQSAWYTYFNNNRIICWYLNYYYYYNTLWKCEPFITAAASAAGGTRHCCSVCTVGRHRKVWRKRFSGHFTGKPPTHVYTRRRYGRYCTRVVVEVHNIIICNIIVFRSNPTDIVGITVSVRRRAQKKNIKYKKHRNIYGSPQLCFNSVPIY